MQKQYSKKPPPRKRGWLSASFVLLVALTVAFWLDWNAEEIVLMLTALTPVLVIVAKR